MTDQTFANKNSSIYFSEYRSSGKEQNVIFINSKIEVKKYQFQDLSDFEGYTPELIFDKKGNYIFHFNGFSNGGDGGPGLTMIAKLDTKHGKFISKYKYEVNDSVLDKSKNLWLLDSSFKDKTNVICKVYKIENYKKVLKYIFKHKNVEPELPISWVNDRLKVINDKEAYIQAFGSNKWTRLK